MQIRMKPIDQTAIASVVSASKDAKVDAAKYDALPSEASRVANHESRIKSLEKLVAFLLGEK